MKTDFTAILKYELVAALGCTEPIAIAYTAAKAREVLGCLPDKMQVLCSGNIVKNVKSVTVPSTHGMKGIDVSALAGAIGGDAGRGYEVLASVTDEHIEVIKKMQAEKVCSVGLLETDAVLDIEVTMWANTDKVVAEVKDAHTHLFRLEKNGEVLFRADDETSSGSEEPHMTSEVSLYDIFEYVNTVDINEVKDILKNQLDKNVAIAEEGLRTPFGANVGKNILKAQGNDCRSRAIAYAAAGSDARMNGCGMPVVINSGSGNQGLTVSMPVYIYAKENNVSEETMYRSLTLSNLVAIFQKSRIGKLSAYCGAISAAIGSGAAITYMLGGTFKQIEDTIVNAIATLSGIVCDGAKSSCAAKIATAVNGAIMAHHMAMNGDAFQSGEGLVGDSVVETVDAYTTMGREGMKETDHVILKMMTGTK